MPQPTKLEELHMDVALFIMKLRTLLFPEFIQLFKSIQENRTQSQNMISTLASFKTRFNQILESGANIDQLISELNTTLASPIISEDDAVLSQIDRLLKTALDIKKLENIRLILKTITSLQDIVLVGIELATPANYEEYGFWGAKTGLMLITKLQCIVSEKRQASTESTRPSTDMFSHYIAQNILQLYNDIQLDRIPRSNHHAFFTPEANPLLSRQQVSNQDDDAPQQDSSTTIPKESLFGNLFESFADSLFQLIHDEYDTEKRAIDLNDINNITSPNDLQHIIEYAVYQSQWRIGPPLSKIQSSLKIGWTSLRSMSTFLGEMITDISRGLANEYQTHGALALYNSIVSTADNHPQVFLQSMLAVLQPHDNTALPMTERERNIIQLRHFYHCGRAYRLTELPDVETLKSQFKGAYIFLHHPVPSISGLSYDTIQGDGSRLIQAVARYLNVDSDTLKIHEQLTGSPSATAATQSSKPWLDEVTLLMEKLDRMIVIIGNDGNVLNLTQCEPYIGKSKSPIFIHYDEINAHYNAFTPNDGIQSGLSIFDQLRRFSSYLSIGPRISQFFFISPQGQIETIFIRNEIQFQTGLDLLKLNNEYPTRWTNECRALIVQCVGTIPESDPNYGGIVSQSNPHQDNAWHYIKQQWQDNNLWKKHQRKPVPYRHELGEVIRIHALLEVCTQYSLYLFAPYNIPRQTIYGVRDLGLGLFNILTTHPKTTFSQLHRAFLTRDGWQRFGNQLLTSPWRFAVTLAVPAGLAAVAAPAAAGAAMTLSSMMHPSIIGTAAASSLIVRSQSDLTTSSLPVVQPVIAPTTASTTIHADILNNVLNLPHEKLQAFLFLFKRTDTLEHLLALFKRVYAEPNSELVQQAIINCRGTFDRPNSLSRLARRAEFTPAEETLIQTDQRMTEKFDRWWWGEAQKRQRETHTWKLGFFREVFPSAPDPTAPAPSRQ